MSEEKLTKFDSFAQRRKCHEDKWLFLRCFKDYYTEENEKEKYLIVWHSDET